MNDDARPSSIPTLVPVAPLVALAERIAPDSPHTRSARASLDAGHENDALASVARAAMADTGIQHAARALAVWSAWL